MCLFARVRQVLCLTFVLGAGVVASAQDRSIADFRKYAAEKLTGVSRLRLDAIVRGVDRNADGVVSADEFARRTTVFREIMIGPEPWLTDPKEAQRTAEEVGQPLLLYFCADWAPPCRVAETKVFPDPGVQRSLEPFVLAKVDIRKFKDLAERHNIRAIPSLVAIDSQGKELGRKIGVGSATALAEWLALLPPKAADEPLRLRILSYNIHHGEGVDGKLDLARIARVIRSAQPDIVALQEVDRKVIRSGQVDQPAELARLTEMKVIFERNIKFGGGEYGNAVLSRLPIRQHRNHKLPNVDQGEQRGVLEVRLDTRAGPLRVLATHFDHRRSDEERMASAAAVNRLLRAVPDVPAVLVGDLNAAPASQVLRSLGEHWVRSNSIVQPTIPVDQPTRQIDYVLFSPKLRWRVVETRVLPESVASDHRPVLAVLELTAAQPAPANEKPVNECD